MKGPEFLKKKYNLQNAPEVKSAAKRTTKRSGEKVPQKPTEQIQNYLDRFNEILEREDPKKRERGIEALKEKLHETLTIQDEDFPESYFDLLKKIHREQGRGTLEIQPAERAQHIEVIRTDQIHSLDEWIDYFASPDSPYEDWYKYFVLRSVADLSEYDQDRGGFGKRTKDTTKRFPDLNEEAVTYIYDVIRANGDAKKGEEALPEADTRLKTAVQSGDFSKMYALALEKAAARSTELFPNTEGEWVKFDKGSDHMALVRTIRNQGTGWCIAGEATAEAYLGQGDFHIYYSANKENEHSIPRAAIRMTGDKIAEVRGVAPKQNLDEYITSVVQDKLAGFPDGKLYEKRVAHMALLTEISKKSDRGEALTKEDLHFLYEIDEPVQGFGQAKDPRVTNLKYSRDGVKDYMIIHNVDEAHMARTQDELKQDTVLLGGYLSVNESTNIPGSLKYITGGVDIEYDANNISNATATKLIEMGFAKKVGARLRQFGQLSAEVAHTLTKKDAGHEILRNLDRFNTIDPETAAKTLGNYLGDGPIKEVLLKVPEEQHSELAYRMLRSKSLRSKLANNLGGFKGINILEIVHGLVEKDSVAEVTYNLGTLKGLDAGVAQAVIAYGEGRRVAQHLESFDALDESVADGLIKAGAGSAIPTQIEKFEPINHMDLCRRLITEHQGNLIIPCLYKLRDIDENEIAALYIEHGGIHAVLQDLESLKKADHVRIAKEIIAKGKVSSLIGYLEKFSGLGIEEAQAIHEAGGDHYLIANSKSFDTKVHPQVALLAAKGKKNQFHFDLDKFDSLNNAVAEEVLEHTPIGAISIAEHIEKFGDLSPKVDKALVDMRLLSRFAYYKRFGKRALQLIGLKPSLALKESELIRPRYKRSKKNTTPPSGNPTI